MCLIDTNLKSNYDGVDLFSPRREARGEKQLYNLSLIFKNIISPRRRDRKEKLYNCFSPRAWRLGEIIFLKIRDKLNY